MTKTATVQHNHQTSKDDHHAGITLQHYNKRSCTLVAIRSSRSYFWAGFVDLCVLVAVLTITHCTDTEEEHRHIATEHNFPELYTRISLFSMWLPSVIGLATYLLIGLSPRGNTPISMLSILNLGLGILFSINAFIFSVLTFGFLAEHEECEEREFKEWNQLALGCVLFVIQIWALPLRVNALLYSIKLSIPLSNIHNFDKHIANPPNLLKLEKVIHAFTKFITAFCMPYYIKKSLKKMPIEKQHKVHHFVQLCYEVILIVIAYFLHTYINLVAICAGLVGSFFGVLKFHKLDIVLNSFAVWLSLVITAVEIAHSACSESGSSVKVTFTTLACAAVADCIRLKSVLHCYSDSQEHTWLWLKDCYDSLTIRQPIKTKIPLIEEEEKEAHINIINEVDDEEEEEVEHQHISNNADYNNYLGSLFSFLMDTHLEFVEIPTWKKFVGSIKALLPSPLLRCVK